MPQANRARVLIIDDDADVLDMVSALLGALGCDVVGMAKNGAEGYDLFKAQRPDLTLLDIQMPVMDGLETLKKIRRTDKEAAVVMLTSVDETVVAEHCCHGGAKGWLRKDMNVEELSQSLQQEVNNLAK